MALLRGYPKKRVTEIQKKLSEKETWLGVLNEVQGIKLRLLVTETSRNRKKKENRGKIDSHQARLLQRKESQWNIYYDVSIKNPHPNSLISINCVFSHK